MPETARMSGQTARCFLKDHFYFDIHGHNANLLPFGWRLASLFRIPKDVTIRQAAASGINGGVVCAIGDPATFRREETDSYELVLRQLGKIRASIEESGASVALGSGDLTEAKQKNASAFMLGIEGGDFIGRDPERLDRVFEKGVRVLVLVHYSKNQLGSVSLGWGGKKIPESEQTGLTPFGAEIVERANHRGMILDLSHADEKTLTDVLRLSRAPVVCSHTGSRSVSDFPRYLSDRAIKEVADKGGLIGLWPFFNRGEGMPDKESFQRHAGRIKDLGGAESLAIGTDFNGVPGYMKGYPNMLSCERLIQWLSEAGFDEIEIENVIGLNFVNLCKAVENAVR